MALFKQKDKQLYPNYIHLPIAYASRSSTLMPSGANLHRPMAHVFRQQAKEPTQQLSSEIDFELEMAMVVGKENPQFSRITTQNALQHIFGLVLLNDWSARDILSWEAAPLGPFNSKNFATGLGQWIVPLQALLPYQTEMNEQKPAPLSYLQGKRTIFNIRMSLDLEVQQKRYKVCRTNLRNLYWSPAQLIAHHTLSGCKLEIADLIATGTVSGVEQEAWGSLIERTQGGSRSRTFIATDGSQIDRTYLQEGDTVILEATCGQGDKSISFGVCRNTLLPPYQQ